MNWKNTLKQFNNQNLRCIHFKLNRNVDEMTWIDAFQDFFNAQAGFFITETSGVFLIQDNLSDLEIMVDQWIEIASFDFSTHIKILIGFNHLFDNHIQETILQEHNLLLEDTSPEVLLTTPKQYIENNFNSLLSSPLFDTLKTYILKNDETISGIKKLWETSGNIAQAASELYIHRNTLIYRIKKFEEDTHLDLKKPHDLLICYLITLEVNHENNSN